MFQQPVHTDVFVSYRRIDVDFVKEFVDALKADNKEVWIDWEDLPPGGAQFTDDIRLGIEGADSFICILSPDYLESTYCVDLELGYALELHKKIIPVVYRKFEDYPIPPGISHINWIYFTPHAGQDNTFDESYPRVIEAIEVDFEYVRDHTRLLQRAREWRENKNKNSYLLIGEEVIEAEAWLTQSASKRPPASVLHHEFIQAGRRWENQKTRRNLTIAIIVMIVSILLAGFAMIQRQTAIEQRAIAEQQRSIAIEERNRAETQQLRSDSRRLAVQSLVASDSGEVDLSLLLGLEAIESAETNEAIGSLVNAFENSPFLDRYLYDHSASLTSVAYHPSRLMMVTGAEDGSLSLWDMETLTVIESIDIEDNEVWDIDFHPNGEQFAVAFEDGSMIIFPSDGAEILSHIEDAHRGVITSLIYSPNGEQLVTTSYDGNVSIWETETLLADSPEPQILLDNSAENTHADWIMDASFSPDGSQLAVMTWDSLLQIWNVASGTLVTEPIQLASDTTSFSVSIAWSPDGRFILMGDVSGNIRYVDAQTFTLLDFVLSRHFDHIREIVYSPDGTFFASVSHDGTILLWNTNSGQPLIESPIEVHSNHVNGVAFSYDGKQMITVGDDGRTVLFDMTRPDLLGETILIHESEIHQVIYIDSLESIISTGLDGNVYLTNTISRESEILFSPEIGRLTATALSQDETLFALTTDTGIMQLWNIENLEPLTDAFTAHNASIFSLAFSPDGTQLASGGDDSLVILWNVASLIEGNLSDFRELSGHEDGVLSVHWHPSESILASASRDNTIRLWDTSAQTAIGILEGHTDDVEEVKFNPTGELLASGSRDHSILLWDVESVLNDGEATPERLGEHDNWVLSLAFSPDGESVVSGGRDRAIILWDIERSQMIGQPLINHEGWVWTVDVSSDSQAVVSGGRDDKLVLWNVNREDWKSLACRIANRSLSSDEWAQYRPETEYRTTCTS